MPAGELSTEMEEIIADLADRAPVRESDGSLPVYDELAIESSARCLHRARKAAAWAGATGRFDDKAPRSPSRATDARLRRTCGRRSTGWA